MKPNHPTTTPATRYPLDGLRFLLFCLLLAAVVLSCHSCTRPDPVLVRYHLPIEPTIVETPVRFSF
jgi:hypothetical protein